MSLFLAHFHTLQAVYGVPAVLARGVDACDVTLVKGLTDGQAITNRESTYSADSQEVLIEVSDYTPADTPTEPQDGDTITYVEASETVVLEARPQQGEKCFARWHGGEVFAVQTKVVSRTPV